MPTSKTYASAVFPDATRSHPSYRFRRIEQWFLQDVPFTQKDFKDNPNLDAFLKRFSRRACWTLVIITMITGLGFWPFDVFFIGTEIDPTNIRTMRLALAFFGAIAMVALSIVPLRYSYEAMVPWIGVTTFGASYFLASIGPVSSPWLSMLIAAPMLSLVPVLPFRVRLLTNSAMAVAGMTGCLLYDASIVTSVWYWHHMIVFLFCTGASVIMGQLLYIALGRVFLYKQEVLEQREQLAALNDEITALNGQLARKVEIRTDAMRKALDERNKARESERMEIARTIQDRLWQDYTAVRKQVLFLKDRPLNASNEDEAHSWFEHQIDMLFGHVFAISLNESSPSDLGGPVSKLIPLVSSRMGFQSTDAIDWFIDPPDLVLPHRESVVLFWTLQELVFLLSYDGMPPEVQFTIVERYDHIVVNLRCDQTGTPSNDSDIVAIQKSVRHRLDRVGGSLTVDVVNEHLLEIVVTLPYERTKATA